MAGVPTFNELAATSEVSLDALALALAAEFREVDGPRAMTRLDGLGEELSRALTGVAGTPVAHALTTAQLLGERHRFAGDAKRYDHPENSMLDVVLARRRGLPILLTVVYVEVARRAGIPLAGVGLPGHFVVGHFGADPPLLLDPFAGGVQVEPGAKRAFLRPWSAHEIAMRMLHNLVGSYQRRGDLAAAMRAARMRLALPATRALRESLGAELRSMQARLN